MNLRKKMELTLMFESYWDMLPPEVHEMIMVYKRGQERIDEERVEEMRGVCEEIKKYGELKRKWGVGHVRCIVKKKMCFSCNRHHLKIIGCYEDWEKIPRETFLGYHFSMAMRRVDVVKSSLFSVNSDDEQ